jgi:predicted phosphodiesterase
MNRILNISGSSKSIRILSDLHLEFDDTDALSKCVALCSQRPTKYTILAGDITNYRERERILTNVYTSLKNHTEKIFYVLGNHEYYKLDGVPALDVVNNYRKLCTRLGIILLENESRETEDYIFYGTTLWSRCTDNAFRRINDSRSLSSKEFLIKEFHEKAVKGLENIHEMHYDKPLIVITHHLPSFKLIDKRYLKYQDMNTAFASDLDYLIKSPISYWIYGHTHTPNNTVINDVRMICNPFGYSGENDSFDDLVIE